MLAVKTINIFFLGIFMKMVFSSQRRELLLFLKYWVNYKTRLNDLINLISNEQAFFVRV